MGVTPDLLPGGAALTDAAATERLALAWGTPPTSTSGLAADGMIGGVSGLVVVAEDLPATPAVRQEALARLECLIVLDAFATPTARAANIVLPIASFAENEGTTTSMEGRVQRVRAATRPPGEARPGWQVLAELAAALGLPRSCGSADDVLREIARVIPAYHDASDGVKNEAWGTFTSDGAEGRKPALRPLTAARVVVALPEVLALDGVFDWGSDPLVAYSPTLCRDHVARRKLYPRGLVEMSRRDADGLGVRQGWTVRLASAHGEAVVPVVLRDDLEPGSLLVPYGFRERVAEVLGGHSEVAVKAQRVG
jgi:predicted molibdopterin-dependent oxidoreductase YjgC